jgi:uncharacterized protein YbcI
VTTDARHFPTPTEEGSATSSASGVVQISNGIAAIVKARFGRGPDVARTTISGTLVVCLLRGGFTTAEQTLAESGRDELIVARRAAIVDAVRDQLAEVVEHAVHRPVVSVMSASDQPKDLQVLVFVLEQGDSPGPERERAA